ncbi:hypothetical protein [Mesorhizobium sp. LNJC403B00]|uniref:hypothetical protein n=1 Tax=Mesorhizobium sp. LNJC403B00 TaxID=1287280 RepID=UPI0012EC5DFF|nr:hypothetical protein [Mesorhizobium sp. LNJC403B00]
MLNIEVRQVQPVDPNIPVAGVVEVKSLLNDDVVRIGQFSIFPPENSEETHSFNFDLSTFKDALSALGPRYEVEVVSVNVLAGTPTKTPYYEIVGATLKRPESEIK